MGDMGDFWRDMKPALKSDSDKRKKRNHDFAVSKFSELGIKYETHNANTHFVIQHNEKRVDYWPTTGKWKNRKSKKYSRGIKGLLKHLQSK